MGYPGNKNTPSLGPQIVNLFPPHSWFWELCLGSGGVSQVKEPAAHQVGIEIDPITIEQYSNSYPSGLIVLQQCAIAWSEHARHLPQSHMIYADPPYPRNSRRSRKAIYRHEWTDEMHVQFLTNLKQATCFVAISSYPNELYDRLLEGWCRHEFKTNTHAGIAIEVVYCNYTLSDGEKHQYNFVGRNRTHRQQIKRKAERWAKRLLQMDADIQNAVFEYLSKNKK